MKFDVRWTRQFSTNFFGQLVRPGGAIQVPANLAIQLHDENKGWLCPEIDKARQSLVPTVDVTITDEDLKEKVQVPISEGVTGPAKATTGTAPDVVPDPPTLQPSLALTGVEMGSTDVDAKKGSTNDLKCDLCPELTFTSKKKLTAHMTQVHKDG